MEILELFKIPNNAQTDNRIYVKNILDNLELSSRDNKILEKALGTVHLKGVIQEDTADMWEYEDEEYSYVEVDIFYIVLKDDKKISFVNEQLHKVFPNPTIFIYEYDGKYAVSTALKRINKVDNNKSVIEDIQLSKFFYLDKKHIELLSHYSYDFKNIKAYYENIDNIVAAEELIDLTGVVPLVINNEIKIKSTKIKQLLKEKKELETQYKEAASMQDRMQIHMKIKDIERKLSV